ncbi:thiazole biosynthesis adenylyltransferase ThiF [bacterium LRH843]|nr:thiazole biosynthesis adenylyltransferase ThiF [bacterium LRH843]
MGEQVNERYSRQIRFQKIGESGQVTLGKKVVLIVGVGALGTVLANHLVRAGVGHVRIVDRDYVEMSNLQRQMLFDENDVKESLPKAIAAERKLRAINSDVIVEGIVADVTAATLPELAKGVDLILDGTDNFQTRFLVNDFCFKENIPFVYGGAVSSRGMTALFIPGKTPCLRCFISQGEGTGQTCDTVGVISPVVDIVASYQTVEAMKYLLHDEEALRGTLRSFDLWANHHVDIKLHAKKKDCPTCGLHQYPALREEEDQLTTLCGRETVQIRRKGQLDLAVWAERLEAVADVTKTPFLLRVQLEEGERIVLFPDGRVLVQGTEDMTRARSLYSKYIGN